MFPEFRDRLHSAKTQSGASGSLDPAAFLSGLRPDCGDGTMSSVGVRVWDQLAISAALRLHSVEFRFSYGDRQSMDRAAAIDGQLKDLADGTEAHLVS